MYKSQFLTIALMASFATAAFAGGGDDNNDTKDLEIKITAPIEAIDLVSTPQTIQVLGLTIQLGPDVDLSSGNNESGDNESENNAASTLAVGDIVQIQLASDAAPLTAVSVELADGEGLRIKAPVQSVDATAQTITVLGLTISTLGSVIEGDDGDSAVSLTAGQIVEVALDPLKYPTSLVATQVSIENNTNEVDVEVDEANGDNNNEDNGDSGNGNADDITEVDVEETCLVEDNGGTAQGASVRQAGGSGKAKMIRVTHRMHYTTHGTSLHLKGLPPGKAKLTITRHGKTVTKKVTIKRNATKQVRVKLR